MIISQQGISLHVWRRVFQPSPPIVISITASLVVVIPARVQGNAIGLCHMVALFGGDVRAEALPRTGLGLAMLFTLGFCGIGVL